MRARLTSAFFNSSGISQTVFPRLRKFNHFSRKKSKSNNCILFCKQYSIKNLIKYSVFCSIKFFSMMEPHIFVFMVLKKIEPCSWNIIPRFIRNTLPLTRYASTFASSDLKLKISPVP